MYIAIQLKNKRVLTIQTKQKKLLKKELFLLTQLTTTLSTGISVYCSFQLILNGIGIDFCSYVTQALHLKDKPPCLQWFSLLKLQIF